MIYLGADHAGYDVKEKLKGWLDKQRIPYEDLGPKVVDPNDDYPGYARAVALRVQKERDSKGILVCGTGVGMCIAANKFKGIRAVVANDKYTAELSRVHNDTNVLCLRGRDFPLRRTLGIVSIWLATPFSNEERHRRRLRSIDSFL